MQPTDLVRWRISKCFGASDLVIMEESFVLCLEEITRVQRLTDPRSVDFRGFICHSNKC